MEREAEALVAPDDEARTEAERARWERDELLTIARALASERDIRKLLGLILETSRQITGADAGSVYVLEQPDPPEGHGKGSDKPTAPKRLRFMLTQNDSVALDFHEFVLPVDGSSIVGQAVLDKRPINIEDLEALDRSGATPSRFRHNRSFDQKTGYRARSMLTVPMLSAREEVLGVVQLINRKRHPSRRLTTPVDFETEILPFDDRSQELALALAAQAGISLENATLYDEIRSLFEGFVDASVTAIESRDPTTSGHSRRVATLSVALAERVDATAVGPFRDVTFTRDELRQIEYAGVLHDFGKVGVRENVLVKAKKLYDGQRESIRLRLDYARKALEVEALERKLDLALRLGVGEPGQKVPSELRAPLDNIDRELEARLAELEALWSAIVAANEPNLLAEPARERLGELGRRTYVDPAGTVRTLLTPDELAALSIPRGSLTAEERSEIQSHVTHTIQFLETIPWTRSFRRIPHIAGAHHESLDGRGYPLGLRGEQIPIEARMLTISDIFDALTASDRPYKPAVPVPTALGILESEVKAGRCDPDLFGLFVEAEVWRKVV